MKKGFLFLVVLALILFQNCGSDFDAMLEPNSNSDLLSNSVFSSGLQSGDPRDLLLVDSTPIPDPYYFTHLGKSYLIGTGNKITLHESEGLQGFKNGDMKSHEIKIDYSGHNNIIDLYPRHDDDGRILNDASKWSIWAPKFFFEDDGTPHLYGAIHFGNFKTAMAHFVPKFSSASWKVGNPITNWKLSAIILGGTNQGDFSSYDFDLVDPKKLSLTESNLIAIASFTKTINSGGRYHNAVIIKKMSSPETFKNGRGLFEHSYPSEIAWGYLPIMEGAKIKKINGKFVMTYSVGTFADNTYKIGVAYADNVMGPYEKVLNNSQSEVQYLIQSQRRSSNYFGTHVNAPGIANLVYDDGKPYLMFHGNKADEPTKFCEPPWRTVDPRGSCFDPRHRYLHIVPLQIASQFEGDKANWIKAQKPNFKLTWNKFPETHQYRIKIRLINSPTPIVCFTRTDRDRLWMTGMCDNGREYKFTQLDQAQICATRFSQFHQETCSVWKKLDSKATNFQVPKPRIINNHDPGK